MKKILVVLLALAVAGGVFAQEGEWSLWGSAFVGTVIDLDPVKKDNEDPALVLRNGDTQGSFGIEYEREGIGVGLSFDLFTGIDGSVTYDGENFKFGLGVNLPKLFGDAGGDWYGIDEGGMWPDRINALWGSYEMLNGMVHLEAAYKSRGIAGEFWTSDTVGAFYTDGGDWRDGPEELPYKQFSPLNGTFGSRDGHTFSNGDNYLLANFSLESLSFGVMIPNIFYDNVYAYGKTSPEYLWGDKAKDTVRHYATDGDRALLVEDILKKMVFGAKFNMQPIEFAAQILMDDYSVYFGGKVGFGNLTVGASFMGILSPTTLDHEALDFTIMRVGGGLDYETDPFAAGLAAWLAVGGDPTAANATQIGFEPYFYYNVIPTHLRFRIDASFMFNNLYNGTEKLVGDDGSEVIWGLKPSLAWNFLGTGAGDTATGIEAYYKVVKDRANELGVAFKYSF